MTEPPRPGPGGILFVDDEPENVSAVAGILAESLELPVVSVSSVEEAVRRLHDRPWKVVVMDLFVPLGDHPRRVLGPRARRYQEHVEHLGGLVLLEEIDRLPTRPAVVSHTACTDSVLHDLFEDRVAVQVPKPAAPEVLLRAVLDLVRPQG